MRNSYLPSELSAAYALFITMTRLMNCRSMLLCLLIAASTIQCGSQSIKPTSSEKSVIEANVRAVKIDVLVTGKHGSPVQGLSESDFDVFEDGKIQRIDYFMEHKEEPSANANAPALPPNTFVNIPRVSPAGVMTIILLDSLNTPIEAQAQVRKVLLSSIDAIKPGNSVAIFTLGFVLRRLQGFTDNPSVLKAALSNPVGGSNPRPSLLLDSKTEQTAEQQEAAAFGSVRTMQQMQSQSATTARTLMTLDAFRQLSGYLAGIEGRKDVIWISGAFPIYLGTNAGTQVDAGRYQQVNDKVKETDAELAGAEIAIYPIGAEGLQGNSLYDVDSQLAGAHNTQEAQTASNQALQADAIHRAANDAVMDEIAEETGGQAFYNSNGLGAALSRIIEQGGDYYTLYYQPTNQDFNGRFRKIKVQISHTSDKLSFRRGYYATGSPQGDPDNLPAGTNPLLAAIVSGAPERTDIPLAVQVEVEPLPVDEAAEKNKQMPAKPVGAAVRYDLHFVVANKGLNLQQTADGKMADSLEVGIFAYSAQGKLNGWALHHLDISLTPAQYQETETNGFNFGLDFVAVGKPVVLRVGAYDKSNGRLGTLEVPLDALVTAKGTDHK